jgi:hypothetical protein
VCALCAFGGPLSCTELSGGNVANSVTILRFVRSSLQRLHRYDKFESSQISEGVAGAAVAWLRAIQFCLCSRRRRVKRFFTASRTSWRRRRWTLWTWRRTRTGRKIRSAESFRFAVPGTGRVAIGCSAEFTAGTAASTPITSCRISARGPNCRSMRSPRLLPGKRRPRSGICAAFPRQ